MDINSVFSVLVKFYDRLVEGIMNSSALVDIQIVVICAIIFLLSAAVMYVISVYGMRERTYEEAIEEQRRRNKEIIQLAKTEKTRKDKKFKKWNKRKDKEECSPIEDMDDKVNDSPDAKHFPGSQHFSSEESKSANPKKKRKQRKSATKEILPQPSSSEDTDEQVSYSSSGNDVKNECHDDDEKPTIKEVKHESEMDKLDEISEKEFDISEAEQLDVFYDKGIVHSGNSETDSKNAPVQSKSPSKRKRKNRSDHGNPNSESSEITTNKVASFLKTGVFSEEELYLLIDVLNSKCAGVGGWTKKNDPIPALKKQIQEKEEALEAEQRIMQATNEKLKTLRQEYNQEKSRSLATERSMREKLNQQQQEIQTLHGTLQLTHEQHVAELQTKMQQIKTKLNEEHSITVQRMKEENSQLQAMNRIESEKQQRSGMEVSRLQRELEQMHSAHEQYDTHQAAMQQAQDDLHHQIQQLEKHMEKLVSSHQDEEFGYKQRINDMSNKLQQADKAHTSLVQELQNAQSVCSSLEADNNSLRQRLEEAKHQMNSSDQDRIKLQSRLEDLMTCIDQLRTEIIDLTKDKKEFIKQIQDLNTDKESLTTQLNENLGKHVADIQVSDDQAVKRSLIDIEELNKKIQEKDYIIQQLLHQFEDSAQEENFRLLEEYKWKVRSLAQELEDQKDLRKGFEEAKVSLTAANLRIESLEKLLNETEASNLEGSAGSKSNDDFERLLTNLQEEMELVEINANKRIHDSEEAANARIESLQESLYQRICEVNAEADVQITEAKEGLNSKFESFGMKTKECFQKLFPDIQISNELDSESWVSQFFQQAVQSSKKNNVSSPVPKEVINLRSQLKKIQEEKSTMKLQIENYIEVLAQAENVLLKVQDSVEVEEKNWREELTEKKKNLDELQCELLNLKKRLQSEEEDRRVVLSKYGKALAVADSLRAKLKTEEMEKQHLGNNLEECAMACSPSGCGEALAPVSDDAANNLTLKSEKRKKSKKKGGAGKK